MMTSNRHRVALGLALVLAISAAPTARASVDEGARVVRATGLLVDAGHLVDVGDYEAARARFQAAYDLVPSWQALSGIALTHDQQGRHLEALETYERLQSEFHAVLAPEHAATVALCILELEARIGIVELDATQSGVEIVVDGVAIGRGPFVARTIRVNPGSHTILATLDGHVPLTTIVLATAGGTQRVRLRLVPHAVEIASAPVRLERPVPVWLPWTAVGAGVAAVALGGGLEYAAERNRDEFREAVSMGPPGQQVAVDDGALRTAEAQHDSATTLFAVGGVAVVTGVVLMLLNRQRVVAHDVASAPRVRMVPTRGGAGVEVSF